VTAERTYASPRRSAQAAATRAAILDAFAEQIVDPDRSSLSPTEAAARAGVSVRTVHHYFPDIDAQLIGLAERFDAQARPQDVALADGPDDLARYFRDIHTVALRSLLARALAQFRSPAWNEVRARRRAERHEAIRRSVAAIGAPAQATEDATTMLLMLSGADICWPMHEIYHLPKERIPDVIANTVQLIVDQLERSVAGSSHDDGD